MAGVVHCKMMLHVFCTWLFVIVAVGMPQGQGQLGQSVQTQNSNDLLYSRPPVQFLDRNFGVPNVAGKPPVASADNSASTAKVIPYGSGNSQFVPDVNTAINDRDRQGDSLFNNDFKSTGPNFPYNPTSFGNTGSKEAPIVNAPAQSSSQFSGPKSIIGDYNPPSFNQLTSVFPSNPKNTNTAGAFPVSPKQSTFFGSLDTNFGQSFQVPAGNFFSNPLKTRDQNSANKDQMPGGNNYVPFLARGFSVPSTYKNNQESVAPIKQESLFTVANPSQDKRQIIGSYMPRNDFVNPQLFNIPAEDKHNIVNRIFGGFKAPNNALNNGYPQPSSNRNFPVSVPSTGNRGNNDGFFNERPNNVKVNSDGGRSKIVQGTQPGSFGNDNDINLSKSYSPSGTFRIPQQNKLSFNGGLNNPGAYSQAGTINNDVSVNANKVLPSKRNNPVNINNNNGKFNAININTPPVVQNNLLSNSQSFNNLNPPPVNQNSKVLPNTGKGVQPNKPPSTDAYQFNSINSFEKSNLFPDSKPGFGSFLPAADERAVDNKDRGVFMDQPPPVPLFSDFSQEDPFTVDEFRSKNLLGDQNFGNTEYDRTRPTSLNLLGNSNDFFGGQSNVQSGNKDFGSNSGFGGFQQVDGNSVTNGNSYDNVFSQSQGYNKNFDDNSNVASSRPSSFTKQGGFTKTYQENDAFDKAGSFSDGDDYASQFNFKDGDSVNNQKSSNNHNEKNFRKSFEDQQQADDQKSYNNADGYNNAYVNGRKYDLTDGYTDQVNYNNQNSDSSQQRFNDNDGYQKGVANVAANLANQSRDLYVNLPKSISDGLPSESSYKPFDVNKPVFGGTVLS